MDDIYKCEDQIEQARFQLAALKIEIAFAKIVRVFERKVLMHRTKFISRFKIYQAKAFIRKTQERFNNLAILMKKLSEKRERWGFTTIFIIWEGVKQPKTKRSGRIKTEDYDEEELNTTTQLEHGCNFYKQKIKQLQLSFNYFFEQIKKQ